MRYFPLFLSVSVLSDLPVSCNYLQILGSWRFHFDSFTFPPDLHSETTTCGHRQPDHIQPLPFQFHLYFNQETVHFVDFTEPNIVKSDEFGVGNWTM